MLLRLHFFRSSLNCTQKPSGNARQTLSLVPEWNGSSALKTSLLIVRKYAEAYENAQVRPESIPVFGESDKPYLAVNLSPELTEDQLTLDLDNALILLYAVAVITSPDDEQALEEHRKYLIKMLETYKRALGML